VIEPWRGRDAEIGASERRGKFPRSSRTPSPKESDSVMDHSIWFRSWDWLELKVAYYSLMEEVPSR
jgi:hypothetical protein